MFSQAIWWCTYVSTLGLDLAREALLVYSNALVLIEKTIHIEKMFHNILHGVSLFVAYERLRWLEFHVAIVVWWKSLTIKKQGTQNNELKCFILGKTWSSLIYFKCIIWYPRIVLFSAILWNSVDIVK